MRLVLIGYFKEIHELAINNGLKLFGYIDHESKHIDKLEYLGNDAEFLSKGIYGSYKLLITPDLPKVRRKLVSLYGSYMQYMVSLISNSSRCSISSSFGQGTIVQSGVNISSEVVIGKFSKLNTLCNVMHNSSLGDYVTVAPNAVILGNVQIGDDVYIGSNATILPNIRIGQGAVIGAGAVVTRDVESGKIMVGNPAKELIK